jgi:hypothetical protein
MVWGVRCWDVPLDYKAHMPVISQRISKLDIVEIHDSRRVILRMKKTSENRILDLWPPAGEVVYFSVRGDVENHENDI